MYLRHEMKKELVLIITREIQFTDHILLILWQSLWASRHLNPSRHWPPGQTFCMSGINEWDRHIERIICISVISGCRRWTMNAKQKQLIIFWSFNQGHASILDSRTNLWPWSAKQQLVEISDKLKCMKNKAFTHNKVLKQLNSCITTPPFIAGVDYPVTGKQRLCNTSLKVCLPSKNSMQMSWLQGLSG